SSDVCSSDLVGPSGSTTFAPQRRWTKVVEPDGPTAYPPQECYPFLSAAFADREAPAPHHPRQNCGGPVLHQSFSKYQLLVLTLHRYWMVWPDNHPMLQATG